MTATDEQLVEGAVEARERSVDADPHGVDEVVAGGRRRLRRRRVAAVVPALALTLAAGGAALAVFGGGGDDAPAPPASRGSATSPSSSEPTSFDGCTTRPSSCDAGAVARWVSERVDGLSVSGDETFEPAASASTLSGFPAGTVYMTTEDMDDAVDVSQPVDDIVFPPQVEIYVAAKGSDNYFWSAEPIDAEGRAAESSVTIRPGLQARVTEREGSTTLAVPEGKGHGAVYLMMQDQSGRGGEALGRDDLVDLVRLLLEDPGTVAR